MKKRIIFAITGATGSLYAVECMRLMHEAGVELHGVISEAGEQVLRLELGQTVADLAPYVARWHDVKDFAAPISSGSSLFDGMVVMPCTMGTLAAVAGGISANLIHRAADVTLKERRPLLLVVRETPLNRTHLQNMLAAHDAGATICPAMPSFYHQPQSIAEMARAFAVRICDQLGIAVPGAKRWGD
ncbi:MAG: UbiX family flavin prenyltransferase [Desulfobulbaceae bacterium]|nr:UbiX family flavin prenyltransferase [Desulfobulbaceae bacterium]